jgi:hypothetical protein
VKRNRIGADKYGLGGLDSQGLLPGTLPVASPRFKAVRHRLCRSPVHLVSRVKVSARDLLVVHLRAGRLRPRSSGQPSYARAAQEGLRMAIISDGYPKVLRSKDDFG